MGSINSVYFRDPDGNLIEMSNYLLESNLSCFVVQLVFGHHRLLIASLIPKPTRATPAILVARRLANGRVFSRLTILFPTSTSATWYAILTSVTWNIMTNLSRNKRAMPTGVSIRAISCSRRIFSFKMMTPNMAVKAGARYCKIMALAAVVVLLAATKEEKKRSDSSCLQSGMDSSPGFL